MLDYSTPPSSDDVPKRAGRSSRRKAVPKLRDSCTGCAASKVRCTKEKPSCSRCARRGIKCEYIVTRRTGRTSCRTSQPVNRAPQLLALRQPYQTEDRVFDEAYTPSMTLPTTMTPSSSGHTSPSQQFEPYPDIAWRGVVSPPMSAVGDLSTAAYMSLAPEMDPIFDPTFPLMESPMSKTTSQFGLMGPDNLSNFGTADFFPMAQPSSHRSISSISSLSSQSTANFTNLERSQSCSTTGSSKCCLETAVSHMSQLLAGASNTCQHSNSSVAANPFSNIQSTIAENKEIMEAVSGMLECSCSKDDYILFVISLILFKVMARYSTAAHVKPTADQGFAWKDPFACGEIACTPASLIEDPFRMVGLPASMTIQQNDNLNRPAAEKVLGELHRVREVIHLVSSRMKEKAASAMNTHRGSTIEENLLSSLTRFPSASFDQVEKDLQVRLRDVSMEMIDILRRD